jgi:hypothetical protein
MSLFDMTSLLTLTSTLIKIAFNFLSSSSFATFIPRYPYTIQYNNNDTSPALNDYAMDRSSNSEDVWITFCLLCSQLIFDISPEFLQVAKDRLLSDDLPDILFSMNSCQLISRIMGALPSLLLILPPHTDPAADLSHSSAMTMTESLFECLIELVFNFYSLLSVVAVPLSPLHQRCREIELSDVFESSQQQIRFGEIFESTLSKFRSQIFFTFLQFFTKHSLILSSRPAALSLLFLDHVKIWGPLFNTTLLLVQCPPSIHSSHTDLLLPACCSC